MQIRRLRSPAVALAFFVCHAVTSPTRPPGLSASIPASKSRGLPPNAESGQPACARNRKVVPTHPRDRALGGDRLPTVALDPPSMGPQVPGPPALNLCGSVQPPRSHKGQEYPNTDRYCLRHPSFPTEAHTIKSSNLRPHFLQLVLRQILPAVVNGDSTSQCRRPDQCLRPCRFSISLQWPWNSDANGYPWPSMQPTRRIPFR